MMTKKVASTVQTTAQLERVHDRDSSQELVQRLGAIRRYPDPVEYGRALARERNRRRFGEEAGT